MRYLTIDTTTKSTALALGEDGRLVGEGFLHTLKTHSERLIPMLDQLLKAADWSLDDLNWIGVVRGPGSFTGIRIGIATALGLAQVLNLPVMGVLSLDALAWAGYGRKEEIVPILDARKNEWYTARYQWKAVDWQSPPELECLTAPRAIAPEEWLNELAALDGDFCFAGDGVEKYRALIQSKLGSRAILLPEYHSLPRGAYAAQAVWQKYCREGLPANRGIEPYYIRLSEAEATWAKKEEARKTSHDGKGSPA